MQQDRETRTPTGLVVLLIYQWILVLICLGYSSGFAVTIWQDPGAYLPHAAFLLFLLIPIWGVAMGFASLAMTRRSRQGFQWAMICHFLLGMVGSGFVLTHGYIYIQMSSKGSSDTRAWAPLFLIVALMWLPFVLISVWAFFYLRRLREPLS
jgi:heme/copper-type cytochrome/quinol oxidase subunit 3